MNDYISDHFHNFWPGYVLAALLAALVAGAIYERSQPPETVVIDGCEYLRIQGQRTITHRGNCTNHDKQN